LCKKQFNGKQLTSVYFGIDGRRQRKSLLFFSDRRQVVFSWFSSWRSRYRGKKEKKKHFQGGRLIETGLHKKTCQRIDGRSATQ